MTDPKDPSVEIALLRGSLYLTAAALKDYRSARHTPEAGRLTLSVLPSVAERADDALARADKLLRDEGRGR